MADKTDDLLISVSTDLSVVKRQLKQLTADIGQTATGVQKQFDAKTGAELSIPIRAELMGYIKNCPKDGDAFIAKTGGAARSDKAFSAYISEAAAKAGLPEGSSPHGLRKAACRRLAEAGCSARQIMAITGHTDIREVERYCREAEKKLLADAAMAKLDDRFDVQKLPNQPQELGNTDDNALNFLAEKSAWRSRQDSNLRPSA